MLNPPDAVVLCGGLGLRLRSVTGNSPKGMAGIGGRPFLELLLRQLRRYGLDRIILAVGHGGDFIQSHFGESAPYCDLRYSMESQPLGTGGALRNAADLITTDFVLVTNGDSYTDLDIAEFVAEHRSTGADMSMVVVRADGRGDGGSVNVGLSGRMTGFNEKTMLSEQCVINAGIYLMHRDLLQDIPSGVQVSLEREVFPRWLAEGRQMRAFKHAGSCVDIGTPERYENAQKALANLEAEVVMTSEAIDR